MCITIQLHKSLLTPPQEIIPHEMLLFCKHCHHNQSVQVDALAKHPEVVAAQQIQVDEHDQLAASLEGKRQHELPRLQRN